MGVSSRLPEGKIYVFLTTALRLRRLQKSPCVGPAWSRQIHQAQTQFDAQLDEILKDIDQIDTGRVIQKLEEGTRSFLKSVQ